MQFAQRNALRNIPKGVCCNSFDSVVETTVLFLCGLSFCSQELLYVGIKGVQLHRKVTVLYFNYGKFADYTVLCTFDVHFLFAVVRNVADVVQGGAVDVAYNYVVDNGCTFAVECQHAFG